LYPVRCAPTDRSDAGFTIVEVLVALAVVAISIVAIGSVMSTNIRGVKALEDHVALMQSAQAALATAIPRPAELAPGALSGQVGDFRWRLDIGPLGGDRLAKDAAAPWIPELVRIQVRSPSGATVDLETVRLMRGSRQ
jgi:general secretion pathway protein I